MMKTDVVWKGLIEQKKKELPDEIENDKVRDAKRNTFLEKRIVCIEQKLYREVEKQIAGHRVHHDIGSHMFWWEVLLYPLTSHLWGFLWNDTHSFEEQNFIVDEVIRRVSSHGVNITRDYDFKGIVWIQIP